MGRVGISYPPKGPQTSILACIHLIIHYCYSLIINAAFWPLNVIVVCH